MFRYIIIYLASLFTFISLYTICKDMTSAKSYSDFYIILGWFAIGSLFGCLITAVRGAKTGNSVSLYGTQIFLPRTFYDYLIIYLKTFMSGILLFLCIFLLAGVLLVLRQGFRLNLGDRE